MSERVKAPRVVRLKGHLTALVLGIGTISTFSYGIGAHVGWRYLNPRFGDWCNRHEFWLMEGGASALGILIGIRIGARLIGDTALKLRSAAVSLIAGAVALYWLTPFMASIARLGWSAPAEAIGMRSGAAVGWEAGQFLDKLLIAGLYFLKTVGFALMVGLALIALVLGVMIAAGPLEETSQQSVGGS